MHNKSPKIVRSVSFSGIDGAGKTTQIENLLALLQQRGMRVRVLRFWDDIATFTSIREGTGHKLFKGDKGIGSPKAPINRRDKNVRGFPMTCIRLFLYLADAISLRRVFAKAHRSDLDFIIFDRFTYDELANLDLNSRTIRFYVRLIMWFVPRPDLSFLLDADPEAARARKPEYPLEFIRINRQAYLHLNQIVGEFTIIAPADLEFAKAEVLRSAQTILFSESSGIQPRRNSLPRIEPSKTGTALS
jgi:thymidylate kinase